MAAPDEEIPGVEPVGVTPPGAVERARPPAVPNSVAPTPTVEGAAAEAVDDPGEVELGGAMQRADVLGSRHPAAPPIVVHHAAVHEAAMHGDPMAQAIEQAEGVDPTKLSDRAQQLAGASSAAGLGTAAQVDRERYRDVDDTAADDQRRVQPVRDEPSGQFGDDRDEHGELHGRR